MYGAAIGDVIGSVYEHDNVKDKDFPLFCRYSRVTDDTVMTVAVAEALMKLLNESPEIFEELNEENRKIINDEVMTSMKYFGNKYPHAGYGRSFREWLAYGTEPYNSWGNGSAMRTSPAGWLFDDLETTRAVAGIQAAVTHDHPEGVKGAEAIAAAVYMARMGATKQEIKEYIEREFDYNLDRTIDGIRSVYEFDVSCQGSVPEAIIAFLEGRDFEDVIRNAISIGGDSDTIAAMAGAIAEAYYGAPADLIEKIEEIVPLDLLTVLRRFEEKYL